MWRNITAVFDCSHVWYFQDENHSGIFELQCFYICVFKSVGILASIISGFQHNCQKKTHAWVNEGVTNQSSQSHICPLDIFEKKR